MKDKLERLAAKITAEQLEHHKREGLNFEGHEQYARAHFHIGKKYARIDVGTSGKYMVDLESGEIFGIKGYGVVHKGHRYGTLDTIQDWNWGDYTAVPVKVAFIGGLVSK